MRTDFFLSKKGFCPVVTKALIAFFLPLLPVLYACSDEQTYAEQKEDERKAINAFLDRDVLIYKSEQDTLHVGRIQVISEQQFLEQDSTTDLSRNEYVLFGSTGVYMQIVRKGVGPKLESGESMSVLARYIEYNIMGDSIMTRNDVFYYATTPDVLDISNSYGTFTASFNTDINGGGVMVRAYSSAEVPAGWLIPFTYIHVGRQLAEDDAIAKVRLIVPHSKGTYKARQAVYPTFYEITFQQTR